MLLAGDIGGTKTLLGLFDHASVRPRPRVVRSFGTLEFDDLTSMIAAFLDGERIERGVVSDACFGVAGPIIEQAATLTNVPWRVEARRVESGFGLRRVSLLNDLEAMAYAVPVLENDEVHVLQEGEAMRHGNMALIAAGAPGSFRRPPPPHATARADPPRRRAPGYPDRAASPHRHRGSCGWPGWPCRARAPVVGHRGRGRARTSTRRPSPSLPASIAQPYSYASSRRHEEAFNACAGYSENSLASSTHSPRGASCWYARQCGRASWERPIFSNVTAR